MQLEEESDTMAAARFSSSGRLLGVSAAVGTTWAFHSLGMLIFDRGILEDTPRFSSRGAFFYDVSRNGKLIVTNGVSLCSCSHGTVQNWFSEFAGLCGEKIFRAAHAPKIDQAEMYQQYVASVQQISRG